MENATKALLIAAAVLIAIVLIALGVRLLSSSKDASGQASNAANEIKTTTESKVGEIQSALTSL